MWAGNPSTYTSHGSYQCHVRLLTVGHSAYAQMSKACREQNCSVTGLLHGIAVCALLSEFPDFGRFYGHTPYSMRPWTGTDPHGALSNETSDIACLYSGQMLRKMLTAKGDYSKQILQVWEIARHFKSELKAEFGKVPRDNELSLLPYISDWHAL
jgi:hypothetical protein